MAIDNAFNRLKREIGIKRCIIIDGNVGDVYLNEKGQIMDLKTYIKQVLTSMDYDNVICWDKVDGTKDDMGSLELVEDVNIEGEPYLQGEELEKMSETSSANTNGKKSSTF